jgi:hypothetical protein
MAASNVLGDAAKYYAQQGPLTDPGPYGDLLRALPGDVEALCAIVQGLVLNFHWASAYGVTLSAERQRDAHARSLRAVLGRIIEIDPRPL